MRQGEIWTELILHQLLKSFRYIRGSGNPSPTAEARKKHPLRDLCTRNYFPSPSQGSSKLFQHTHTQKKPTKKIHCNHYYQPFQSILTPWGLRYVAHRLLPTVPLHLQRTSNFPDIPVNGFTGHVPVPSPAQPKEPALWHPAMSNDQCHLL